MSSQPRYVIHKQNDNIHDVIVLAVIVTEMVLKLEHYRYDGLQERRLVERLLNVKSCGYTYWLGKRIYKLKQKNPDAITMLMIHIIKNGIPTLGVAPLV